MSIFNAIQFYIPIVWPFFLAQVVSMLRDSKLKVFYSPPANDLRLNLDLEEERDRQEYQRPWPDLENLFGDDLEYQKYLTDIGSYMAMQLEQVKQFSHVSFPLMENVFLTYQSFYVTLVFCIFTLEYVYRNKTVEMLYPIAIHHLFLFDFRTLASTVRW